MIRILVVDDNPVNSKLAGLLLAAAGYGVLTAEDAGAALTQILAQRPDLILMDLQLPGVDGLTLTRRLKADPQLRDIPIIALTALAKQEDEQQALAAGCDGYIAKPIDTRGFTQQVARFLPPPSQCSGALLGDLNGLDQPAQDGAARAAPAPSARAKSGLIASEGRNADVGRRIGRGGGRCRLRRSHGLGGSGGGRRQALGQHLDGHTDGAGLPRLQGADAHDLARHLLAALAAHGDHHAILARLIRRGVPDGAVEIQRVITLRRDHLRSTVVETQMMPAAGANGGAFQYRRLAVGTGAGSAEHRVAQPVRPPLMS